MMGGNGTAVIWFIYVVYCDTGLEASMPRCMRSQRWTLASGHGVWEKFCSVLKSRYIV